MTTAEDFSYLLERQGDPVRLKRKAFEDFVSARNSGRLIGFMGSYASTHLDYPSWLEMIQSVINYSKSHSKGTQKTLIADLLREEPKGKRVHNFPEVDLMDLAELLAGIDKHSTPEIYQKARKYFEQTFSLQPLKDFDKTINAAEMLVRDLRLTRFMTLNYDLELEYQVFLTDFERTAGGDDRQAAFDAKVLAAKPGSFRRERAIAGRGRVASDIVTRNNSAQLFEFALDSPALHSRVLHMHGRADNATELLVTRRDYRDRYWQGGYTKLPFEYGMRLIFSGNPILFAGIGGNEADVMRVLEQLLSDNPNRRAVPMFMLWNSVGKEEDDTRRLLFNRKFGIHVLFDKEIAALVGGEAAYERELADYAKDDDKRSKAFRLAKPIALLGDMAEKSRSVNFWKPTDFRDPQTKYDRGARSNTKWRDGKPDNSYRIDIWHHDRPKDACCGPVAAEPLAGATVDGADPSSARRLYEALSHGSPIKAIIGEPGSGRGAIADAIAQDFEEKFRNEPVGRLIVVNGAFATETDSIFSILSGAFDQQTAQSEEISRVQSIGKVFRPVMELAAHAGRNPLVPQHGGHGPSLTMGIAPSAVTIEASKGSPAEDKSAPIDKATDRATDGDAKAPTGGEADDKASNAVAGPASAGPEGPLVILINGMERFFAHDGSALSNELDMLIRLAIRGNRAFSQLAEANGMAASAYPVTLILVGTKRLERYLDVVAPDLYETLALSHKNDTTSLVIGDYAYRRPCKPYFQVVADRIEEQGGKVSVPPLYREKGARRRNFFVQIFDGVLPNVIGTTDPGLAFGILRVLAYIGQPTEVHVLYHAPSLTKGLDQKGKRKAIDLAIDDLKKLSLILEIDNFPNGSARLGLHKSVIAEIRERYGVPMSDSRLANGFNMSLFAALPVDNYTPDKRWHDEIGKLVDFLMGAYQDDFTPPFKLDNDMLDRIGAKIKDDEVAAPLIGDAFAGQYLARLASAEITDCARAALSLLRGYYSVSALLMHSDGDLDPWLRDGPLTEHAERLSRLSKLSQQVVLARRLVREELGDGKPLGPEALYPDDLVWLSNELAVVRTTQGSLYDARRALTQASRANDELVEFGDRQHNWRRIELNRLQVDIERGMIERAEDHIRDIELVIENQATLFASDPPGAFASARDYVFAHYATDITDGRPNRIDPVYPTDLVLTLALTQGYRGLTQHLRGALDAARASFDSALKILLRLNEQRAYAFFLRHYAHVLATIGDGASAEKSLRLCIAAAGHSWQADIDHAGRISLVQYGLSTTNGERRGRMPQQIPQLDETLRYAIASDMYRLQIEAMQNLASVHLGNGDADSALRFATDASAIATRCGFGLRKVSLRVLLGRVMAFRKDLAAARELFESAALIATKLHYERAVEAAENERVRIAP